MCCPRSNQRIGCVTQNRPASQSHHKVTASTALFRSISRAADRIALAYNFAPTLNRHTVASFPMQGSLIFRCFERIRLRRSCEPGAGRCHRKVLCRRGALGRPCERMPKDPLRRGPRTVGPSAM